MMWKFPQNIIPPKNKNYYSYKLWRLAITMQGAMMLYILCYLQILTLADRISLLPSSIIGFQQQQFGVHYNPNQPCDKTRKVYTDNVGEFSDGPTGINYTQDSHCEWLIKAQNSSQFITLTFISIGTECSYDYIYVYDGDSFNSTLLGSFSGRTDPQRLVAKSGSMLILLYSDTNYVLDGFRANYYISNCLNNCHGNGKCIGHQCVCHGEWIGPDCENQACPDRCGEEFGRGKCVNGLCKCSEGYSGKLCDLKENPDGEQWRWLATDDEGMTARAAHTAVYLDEQDSLYIFGGYDLNNVLSSLQIYRFKKSQWEDEWGISLQNRHNFYQPSKIDNTLLKAVLSNKNNNDAKLFGFRNDASFFSNILYTLAESNLSTQRKQRSPIPTTIADTTNDEIADILDEILVNVTDGRPKPRYGHASEKIQGGFVIFGGKLENGDFSNELWFYNVSDSGGQWSLRAKNSSFMPPPLARHTLTLAGEYLYVFGGSLQTSDFSSRIFRIKIEMDSTNEQWEEIFPHGGKSLDVRLVAHSTIYYRYTNSLIIYGGIMTSLARFSKLSDRIFSFQLDKYHWTEILYPRTALRDTNIPRERAFHTATIAGNYMIIFGGYTHRHNKEEICYDNQMYLYHLGCHTWINQEIPSAGYQYPKKQGVFGHAAAVRNSSTLLIVGGYHGNVNSDLFAYELPKILRVRDPENYSPEESCRFHQTQTSCLSDPECGWCSADSSCYGRTIGANCTTNLQTTRCPGICPSLGDCHSCLVHGSLWSVFSQSYSIASKLGLNQCTWCVQNARCHHKDNNYGVCGETESQIPGWWGTKGTEISNPLECTQRDNRPGLTYIKYNYPVNLTMPDFVSIVNATMVDFASSASQSDHIMTGEMTARLLGFVRPPKSWTDLPNEMLQICTSYATASLISGVGDNLNSAKEIANITAYKGFCNEVEWPSLSERFIVDFQARRKVGIGGPKDYQKTNLELQHYNSIHMNSKAFTFEYLEPYSAGNCPKYTNCLQCLTDALCGWCDLTSKCLQRSVNETIECSLDNGTAIWKYMTIQPSQCANCSNYIACNECIDTGICEWWPDETRCARIGRSTNSIRSVNKCPTPCQLRNSCNDCLNEKGRCVWCEATAQCFSFSVYTSEYQFGICREWLDRIIPSAVSSTTSLLLLSGSNTALTSTEDGSGQNTALNYPLNQKCKTCSQHRNCSTCLQTLSCGWCFDRDYPIEGICMQGDFSRPIGNCGAALNTSESEAEWAYAQCPDVDECGLKLDNCHKEAKCTNTHGSFNCHCRRGYVGDGRISCIQTCFETCIHGQCSGSPDYQCRCDLGWTGKDCSINCGCNNHSTCEERVGKCDNCLNWTEGEKCERCRPGSYGNATSGIGCAPCECNGHGNQDLGICNNQTGECFCIDNTGGLKCEVCNREYYGEPKEGGQCFFQCESRGMLTEIGRQGIGSRKSYKNPWGGPEVRECLWLITPKPIIVDPLIQIDIDWDTLNVQCDENAAYIYDSLPDLTGNTQQSQLIAVVCSPYSNQKTIETRSTHLTVHYKQGGNGDGFNALYNVRSCNSRTCLTPHICDENNRCICPPGFVGSKCDIEICPKNCSAKQLQGYCDRGYGRCVCQQGYAGTDCSDEIISSDLIVYDLFNTLLLSESYDHLRKTIPRFGHTLSADKRGSLWMFGGYSLSNGPLNDIRQFDTKNGTWMQVTVDSTPDAKMPLGRYFHGAEIHSAKQTIYIFGGLTSQGKGKPNQILNDFWQFSIQNQRWNEIDIISVERPPPLAGHTLTFIKMYDKESLILIGGLSTKNSTHLEMWEYNLEGNRWEKLYSSGARMPPLYGHSTVYHSPSQIVYVFGGYSGEIQKKLYALNLQRMQWTELPAFSELNLIENMLPRARYFHSAVTTDSYMIVYGGRSSPYNATDSLIVYVYECNQWIRLTEDVRIIGKLPKYTYAEAMTIDSDNKAIYIVGGWDGSSQSRVTKITLPDDICQLWSSSKYLCRHYMGCNYCGVTWNDATTSYCYSNDNREICEIQNGTLWFNNGAACDDAWIARRNCSTFTTCSGCLASWPSHFETTPICQWCDGCGIEGRCLPAGAECERGTAYCKKHTTVGLLAQCPPAQCHTLNCESCFLNENCQWAVNDVKITECITKDLVERNGYKIVAECPLQCDEFANCTTCLDIESENPKFCKWSTALQACISPETQPIYCAGGVCGLVLDPKEQDQCPEPCQAYTQCSTCSRHAHCGWCARDDGNGDGVCAEGSLESLSAYQSISTCDIIYANQRNLTIDEISKETFSWNYVTCPPEDECLNMHHNCDSISQRCVDSDIGYKCVCGEGYKDDNGECVPVCPKGCVRGQCIKPDSCLCDFGYVGQNCSIQCQCNGHSNCAGPDKLSDCLECHNNTMGAQCEKCKPLYVGNPKDNGKCVPCLEFCNGHTDVCISDDAPSHIKNMTRLQLENELSEGPSGNATCLRCGNKTAGDRCDTCILGYFRGTDNESDPCRLCECHGHGDICDPITGEKCNCGNNTESDATCIAGNVKNSAQPCWSSQCSKCRDSYAGTPIDGHQCYKQISVEVRMCFDALPIEQCKLKPSPLRPGQTVFFVIQPRFMNVDIRVIIDVTQGELDVFMSPQEDSFVVNTNQSTGHHHLFLDNKYLWQTATNTDLTEPLNIAEPINYGNVTATGKTFTERQKIFWTPSIRDCKSLDGKGFYVKDQRAKDLSTYITLQKCNTLLRLFNLKNRLVLTLPQNAHNLSATRFFIALRASPGSDHSYGSIVFRQDQLHIDLFVFFSVFFSCFFLFLAICVVAWKAKQAADLRRARRRHVVEMFQMAKRPFACVFVTLPTHQENENSSPVLQVNRRSRGRSKSTTAVSPHQSNLIRPIAIEPTVDNIAAVGTVFISLPGRHISPVSLALGSSLITLPRQYPLTTRTFLRRRVSHSHPAIVQVQQQPAAQPQQPILGPAL